METYQDELGIPPSVSPSTQEQKQEDEKMIDNLRLYLAAAKKRRHVYNAMFGEITQEKKALQSLKNQTEDIATKVAQYLNSEVTPNLSNFAKAEHEALMAPLKKLRAREIELESHIHQMQNRVEEKRMKLSELQKMKSTLDNKRQSTEEKYLVEETVNRRYADELARVQSEIQTLLLR